MLAHEREDQGARVVAELISFIERRQYMPGERLPSERELAERFSVGRGVIREVLTSLENMRYIERRPNSGVFLCAQPNATSVETLVLFSETGLPLDPEIVAECTEVRRILEAQAIRLACERHTASDVAALRATTEAFDRSIEAGDHAAVGRLDYEFHMNIFRATHNSVLIRLVTPFYIMSKNRREAFFADPARAVMSNAQHRAMTDAIEANEVNLAEDLMAAHIGRVEKYFLPVPEVLAG